MTTLRLDQIRTDGGTQSRVQLDWIATSEYAAAMQEGAQFPPVVVFHDGQAYWLADGFHRIRAAEKAGLTEFPADIRQGTRRDAVLYSVGANANHGVRRTNADKRAAVLLLLNDDEWSQWSDREIARRCGVSQPFVSKLRPETESSYNDYKIENPPPRKVTRNGATYTIDTTNIGKRSDPKPEPAPQMRLPAAVAVPQPAPAPVREPEPIHDEPDDDDAYDWTEDEPEPEPEPVRTPRITIINADAQQLHALDIEPVQLVITSPPYNVGIDYDIAADELLTHIELLTSIWRQCFDVMVDGGRIAVVVPFGVGRNPWVPLAAKVMDSLTEAGFTLRGQIIWDKNTSGNRTSWGSFRLSSDPSLRDTAEAIVVAHKGGSRLELPPSVKLTDEKGVHTEPLADSDYFMELAQDHWVVAPESAQRVKHPAPFPVELVKRLIHFYAYPGAHLLDPFAGSGTVGIAAKETGCDATLIELSAAYCELAEGRLNA